jgi:hypothetical protein
LLSDLHYVTSPAALPGALFYLCLLMSVFAFALPLSLLYLCLVLSCLVFVVSCFVLFCLGLDFVLSHVLCFLSSEIIEMTPPSSRIPITHEMSVVLLCLVLSCLVLSCLAWSRFVASYRVVLSRIVSCRVVSCLVLSCLVLSGYALALFCLALPCRVVSCLFFSCHVRLVFTLAFAMCLLLLLSSLVIPFLGFVFVSCLVKGDTAITQSV